MKATRVAAAAALIVASGLAMAQSQQAGIKRTNLLRHDLSVAGREVVQVRVDFAPGVSFPPHSHPGEELAYVIEGSLEYWLEGKPPVILKAGDVLFIPAGTVHSAKNVGSGNAAELATYLVEKGKPLVAFGPRRASRNTGALAHELSAYSEQQEQVGACYPIWSHRLAENVVERKVCNERNQ
jgi:quercetin dioxygenase-like cupin family protein